MRLRLKLKWGHIFLPVHGAEYGQSAVPREKDCQGFAANYNPLPLPPASPCPASTLPRGETLIYIAVYQPSVSTGYQTDVKCEWLRQAHSLLRVHA